MEVGVRAGADADERLVTAARSGSEVALAEIIERHHGRMMRVTYLICRDRDLAADAVQAAWLKAWRSMSDLREPQRLEAWLVAIAANEARQLMRRKRRETAVQPPEGVESPEVTVSARIDLERGLAALSVDDRALIGLRYLGGLTSAQIADAQHTSSSAVRGRLARALSRLRREMSDEPRA